MVWVERDLEKSCSSPLGHLPLSKAAPSPVQPGLGHLQGWETWALLLGFTGRVWGCQTWADTDELLALPGLREWDPLQASIPEGMQLLPRSSPSRMPWLSHLVPLCAVDAAPLPAPLGVPVDLALVAAAVAAGAAPGRALVHVLAAPEGLVEVEARGTDALEAAQGVVAGGRAAGGGAGALVQGAPHRYRRHPIGTGCTPQVQEAPHRYRVHPIGTGGTPQVQGNSRGYRVHPIGTGGTPQVQGAPHRYRVHSVGTGYTPQVQNAPHRYRTPPRRSVVQTLLELPSGLRLFREPQGSSPRSSLEPQPHLRS
uniref:Uncharacterized protein n=1 Tax=Taeniopygia guttata TaxID=59729 RepID=A0A674GV31_TAEGU